MAFDYKKEYKEFYLPSAAPSIVDVPEMNFIAVRGSGDPNGADGEYKRAMDILYTLAYTIRMSRRAGMDIAGWFDYVVPPLEGFWWMDGVDGIDYSRKADFRWISVIRLPDFVTEDVFGWAVAQAEKKKKQSLSAAEYLTLREGLCVQCLHGGPYDDEPATIELMDAFAAGRGYAPDFAPGRLHHEIYLSDARRVAPERLRTVIRHPVKLK